MEDRDMEITIIKKVYVTEDIPDDLSPEELKAQIESIIDDTNDDDAWDDTDWRGKETYEAYDTYSGCTVLELER